MGVHRSDQRVTAHTPVSRAIRLILLPRVRKLLTYQEAVRGNDVEGVHQMRVATKRLREASRLFRRAVGRKRLARHIAALESLNDALGAVRELDVLAMRVDALTRLDPSLTEPLAPFRRSVERRSDAARAHLSQLLSECLPVLYPSFRHLVRRSSLRSQRTRRMPFARYGQAIVRRRLLGALALEIPARNPEAVTEFHAMRIAVKKLKYALELFLSVLGKPAQKAYGPVSELQEVMGEVHDWDVLIHELQAARAAHPADAFDQAIALAGHQRASLHAVTLAHLDSIHRGKSLRALLKALR